MCLNTIDNKRKNPTHAYKWFALHRETYWENNSLKYAPFGLRSPLEHNRSQYYALNEWNMNHVTLLPLVCDHWPNQRYSNGYHGYRFLSDAKQSYLGLNTARVLLRIKIKDVVCTGRGDGAYSGIDTPQVVFQQFKIDLTNRENRRKIKKFNITNG